MKTPITLQQVNALIFLVTLGLLTTSCGRKVSPGLDQQSYDSSSRLPVPLTTNTPTSDIALCNKRTTPYFTAHLMAYYDPANTYHKEYIRLYIPQMHANLEQSNYKIVLRKWMASLQGDTVQDDTPLTIKLERLSDHYPVSAGFDMNAIHWPTIAGKLQSTFGTNFSMNDALTKFSFVVDLKDLEGNFDVLKFSLYKDGKLVEDANMLIPAFYANPDTYASTQNGVLAQFHPFYNQSVSTFETSELMSIINGYCF